MAKIFLSVGAAYTPEQEAFVAAFEALLSQSGCERLTVGRGAHYASHPIQSVREHMESAEGTVVIAFTRTMVESAVDKPGSPNASGIKNTGFATIWNQMEAAMSFGLRVPLLVILEKGMHQEAMLKDRHEFRTFITPLDPLFFKTDEFKAVFADWLKIIRDRKADRKQVPDSTKHSVREMLGALQPGAFWSFVTGAFAVLAAVAGGAFWLGSNLSPHADHNPPPANVQPAKTP